MSGYDFSGLWYTIWTDAAVTFILGLIVLIGCIVGALPSKKWLLVAIVGMIIGFGYSAEYIIYINNPQIEMGEGILIAEHRRDLMAPFTWEYTFEDSDGQRTSGYLDSFTRKKMLPERFIKGEKYRIYYEDQSNIIVKIEKLE